MKKILTIVFPIFLTTTNILVAQKKAKPYKNGDFRFR